MSKDTTPAAGERIPTRAERKLAKLKDKEREAERFRILRGFSPVVYIPKMHDPKRRQLVKRWQTHTLRVDDADDLREMIAEIKKANGITEEAIKATDTALKNDD